MNQHSTEKSKVRFLTCLWGREHRARWLALSVPSLLAPGNLPALSDSTDLEVVILTEKKSERSIRGHPVFHRLQKICQVRFIAIDDLIVGTTYGVTLTLAYARGIIDAGINQTSTTFVFMNSDFIIADGSLATLANKINAGHRCIVAPSLRASAERLLPQLRKAVKHNELSLKPRVLVGMALANLHPTTIGKIVDQGMIHCVSFNQAYWRIGRSTLLGRYHLLFMLCIRPERPLGPVNSYCDYGLIPELVPGSPLVPLTDSDEFFMLELGPEDQEANLLRPGTAKLALMAKGLRQWTTKEHRQSADFDFIFHSGPIPQNIPRVSKIAESFIASLHARMGKRPATHVNHYYWVRGLQHWMRAKATGPVVRLPPELSSGRLEKWLVRYASVIAWIQGTSPNVPMRAYDWNDCLLVRQWLSSLGDLPEKSVLFICAEDSRVRGWLAASPQIQVLTLSNDHFELPKNGKSYRYILLHVQTGILRNPDRVLKPLLARLTSGGEIAIFIGGLRRSTAAVNISPYLKNFIFQAVWRHSNEMSWDVRSVHGYLQRFLGALIFRITDTSFDDFFESRPRWAPLGIVASAVLMSAIAIFNATSVDRLARRISNYRSAALLCCRRLDETREDCNWEGRPEK
jgi:hypothetical protein